ncbi:acetyl-CoA C-acetyltransferase [Amylibacter sp.]|jgi:acetyl-CoA C-acetyltransferase|nr:acetyl-CoA C-acetyltransferase [Rhodobacterales bacterium]MDA7846598.1 acetyl-CoA C-acetyltransferase [Amylibacter sp.]MDC1420469.1 acetyl-CoA C-acetyltransferase [bacterium]MBT4323555.1 acetyl-CoA C-acetyltransferase [Rhodobacterales bacterium]MBT4471401.1 acetyl-CoA C-acetyltransferase [Rhodobacterales bacterium]
MRNGNESVVIVSATRTAVGSFCGGLASIPAHDLGAVLIKKVAESANIDLSEIDEVILGQILTAGQGQNPARQAAMKAGVPEEKTAFLVNQLCGSGLRAVALGAQQLILGDANIIIAGGQESMSQSHHSAFLRLGKKMGSMNIEDTMIKDGLNDGLFGYHMGVTAENISKKFKISRKKQDAFALNSQLKASKSQLNGKFIDEITPINIQSKKENKIFKNDEYIRTNINLQAIEKLQPAFDDLGTVTAANSSGLNDGAAVVLLMREKDAIRRGLTPLARIASWATAGVDPKVMGTGPIPASKKALSKAGWNVNDLDLIEVNEAFAAQAISVNQEMGWNPENVNVNGGAIAIGHPVGASGCRVLVTLLHEMKRRNSSKGLATLCIGGGMGIALTVECFS